MRSARLPLSGWGVYHRQTCDVYRPERQAELARLVTATPPSTIARGMGRSYGDSSINRDGSVLLCQRLNRFIDFDSSTGIVTCEPGVTFKDLIAAFLPRGWFPAVTPGTQFVSVGGAIAADVHGKNHHVDGTIGRHVIEFDLLTPDGRTLLCSRDSSPQVFRATLGGMGLTGVITRARLKLIKAPSAFLTVEYRRARNLEAALGMFAADEARHRFSVAWIDCLAQGEAMGRSVLMSGDFAEADALPPAARASPHSSKPRRTRGVPFNFPGFCMNRFSVRLFNSAYYNRHADGAKLVDYESFFYPLDSVHNWNRLYGRKGFIQYQALFPAQSSAAGLRSMLTAVSGSGLASFLAVLKSTGEQGEGLLSYPFKGHTLALDIPNRTGLAELVDRLDHIVLEHGGRLYLAKDSMMSRETFAQMYPQLPQFMEIRRRLDPDGRLASDQARRLGIA